MLSVDTETTGVDFRHGAAPYFVTTCDGGGQVRYLEWEVDPLTRAVDRDRQDLEELLALVLDGAAAGGLVLQNSKFDVTALNALDARFGAEWPWADTEDTLIAGHVLGSNRPHDLTSMCLQYLGRDLQPYEKLLERACNEARRLARSRYPDWAIAKRGRSDMPSAKEKCWKYDGWLPRRLAQELDHPHPAEGCKHDWAADWLCARCGGHGWWTVLRDYANADSAGTLELWTAQAAELQRRRLTKIYNCRKQAMRLAYTVEGRGVTLSKDRLRELRADYGAESAAAGARCVNIAAGYGYELELPKSGNNKSLLGFCFGLSLPDDGADAPLFAGAGPQGAACKYLDLPVVERTDTGAPSLNKAAMDQYLAVLPPNGLQMAFVRSLLAKRKRDTALNYMEGYERFWLPWVPVGEADPETGAGWYVLHPSLNPTGTDTLRWSSSNPNEQNISKQEGFNLRYCFGPAPGREWWSCDAKNIELRLPAYESGERELIALFERPDDPPYYGSTHLLNFHTVYPDVWEKELREVGHDKVGPHCKKKYEATWYKWCKNGGFAVQYGAVDKPGAAPGDPSTWGTADRAFHRHGSHGQLKARFGRLEALNQRCIRFAERHGYVETLPDRNVDPERGYPLMCTRTEYGRILETVPLNYHVQGSAMWWTHKAMIRCEGVLAGWRRAGFDAWIVMQVHDEIVFDLPRGADPRKDPKRSNLGRVRRLAREMERGGDDYGIPTPVGVEYHPEHWALGVSF